jgi:hypothetical protein
MTSPVVVTIASLTLVLALVLAWWMRPRPPALDGERWFKAWIATLLRGRLDAAGATPEAWGEAVDRLALVHPAGRPVEGFLGGEPPLDALRDDAARALAEALRPLDPRARWEFVFSRDPVGRAARLGDPNELGASYLPSSWLGPGWGWDAIAAAAVDPTALLASLRAASSARWALVPDPVASGPDLIRAIEDVLGDRAVRLDGPAPSDVGLAAFRGSVAARRPGAPGHVAAAVGLVEAFHALTPSPADRLVIVAAGAAIHPVLDALLTSDALRDQVDAVVALAAPILGQDGAAYPLDPESASAFVRAWFTHAALDLEAAHRTPYFSLQWLVPGGPPFGAYGLPLARARFPVPADQRGPRDQVDPVDLGPLAPDDAPLDLIALALVGVVTAWVRARRP